MKGGFYYAKHQANLGPTELCRRFGCYTVMNIDEQELQQEKAEKYDRMCAQLQLMCALSEGRRSGEEEGYITSEDVRKHFRERANAK